MAPDDYSYESFPGKGVFLRRDALDKPMKRGSIRAGSFSRRFKSNMALRFNCLAGIPVADQNTRLVKESQKKND